MRTIIDEFIEEGLKQGIQQGIQQGLQQGSLKNAQEMVLLSIETKVGHVPFDIERKIREITDCNLLKELLKKIILEEDILSLLKKELFC